MSISALYSYIVFDSFADLVNWLTSYIPYTMLAVFFLNCFFNILLAFIRFVGGGKR